MDKTTETEIEAAAYRRLRDYLREHTNVQNIDLMNLAGFCRNCLSKWYRAEAEARGVPCAEAGVLGALCGMAGSLQATEVLMELLGIGDSLSGALIVCEGLVTTFRKITIKRDPGCPLCGDDTTITDLSVHKE